MSRFVYTPRTDAQMLRRLMEPGPRRRKLRPLIVFLLAREGGRTGDLVPLIEYSTPLLCARPRRRKIGDEPASVRADFVETLYERLSELRAGPHVRERSIKEIVGLFETMTKKEIAAHLRVSVRVVERAMRERAHA